MATNPETRKRSARLIATLIHQSAQPRNTIKCHVSTDDWEAVVTAKSRNPIVVFSQTCPAFNEFSINLGCSVSNFGKEPKQPISLQEKPRFLVCLKQHSQFRPVHRTIELNQPVDDSMKLVAKFALDRKLTVVPFDLKDVPLP